MSKSIAFPFFTLTDRSVNPSRWLTSLNDAPPYPVEEYITGWDYSSSLSAYREVHLDWNEISKELGCPKSFLHLEMAIEIGTGLGRYPRKIIHEKVYELSYTTKKINISASLDCSSMSSRLQFKTQIYLVENKDKRIFLAPSKRGSKLWSEIVELRIEGGEPRFPVEETSFQHTFRGKPLSNALWYLDWDPLNIDSTFSGSVRLYLNSDRPDFIAKFQSSDKFTLQMVSHDIVSQMVEHIIGDADFQNNAQNYESDSVGGHIYYWITTTFGIQPIKPLYENMVQRPSQFRSALLAMTSVNLETYSDY